MGVRDVVWSWGVHLLPFFAANKNKISSILSHLLIFLLPPYHLVWPFAMNPIPCPSSVPQSSQLLRTRQHQAQPWSRLSLMPQRLRQIRQELSAEFPQLKVDGVLHWKIVADALAGKKYNYFSLLGGDWISPSVAQGMEGLQQRGEEVVGHQSVSGLCQFHMCHP